MNLTNIRQRWVKALRSGRYTQAQGALSVIDSYDPHEEDNCCLGVVCRVARAPRLEWQDEGTLADFDAGVEIREALGLSLTEMQRLVGLNDNGTSFERIADYIESDTIMDAPYS